MSDAAVEQRIEAIAQALVGLDPDDWQSLFALQTACTELAEWSGTSRPEFAIAARAAAERVEAVITEERPREDLRAIGDLAEALQRSLDRDEPLAWCKPPKGFGIEPAADNQFIDSELLGEFVSRGRAALDEAEQHCLRYEQSAAATSLDPIRRTIHTFKGEAGVLGLDDLHRLCHDLEDRLLAGRQIDPGHLLAHLDWIRQRLDHVAGEGPRPPAPQEALAAVLGAAPAGPEPAPTQPEAAPAVAEQPLPEPIDWSQPPTPPPAQAQPPPELPREDSYDLAEAVAADPHGPAPAAGPALAASHLMDLTADPEMLAEFVIEGGEHLEQLDLHLLALETAPDDVEAINGAFRAFHTIKGLSGFMQLDAIQHLSHETENLLDRARKGVVPLDGERIDLVFESIDGLRSILAGLREAIDHSRSQVPILFELEALVTRLAKAQEESAKPPTQPPPAPAKPPPPPAKAPLDGMPAGQPTPPANDRLPVFPLPGEEDEEYAQEDAPAAVAGPQLGELLVETGVISRNDLVAALDEQAMARAQGEKKRLGEVLVASGRARARDVAHALREQDQAQRAPSGETPAARVRDMVKVDALRLDRLVDAIGELVIAETMVAESPEMLALRSVDLNAKLNQLGKITRELQEIATSLRMVPVKSTFQRMARLARDVSHKTGKPVDFRTSGEDTELDKTVVDQIGDPLVHMIRNSIDHGIEPDQADRRRAGKPAAGRVELKAFHQSGQICIQVSDDGRGLDRDRILAKALERGLVDNDAPLSDQEIYNLVFAAGFSTADQVSDLSGRGVGMDVVRRNIEAMRGRVEITSQPGHGTTFTIRLPLTLAIIDGMVVAVGTERYIVPTMAITMTIRPDPGQIATVLGRGSMLDLHGHMLPVFRLADLFAIDGANDDPERSLVVVVEAGDKRVGLVVDELLGQQQIVIKSLGETLRGIPGLSGGAIMSDGSVGLILDPAMLIKLATVTV